jgi:hypothetical protein
MGHVTLARTARSHALRAVALTWGVLTVVLAATMAVPHAWFAPLVPGGYVIIPTAMVVAAGLIAVLPLQRLGTAIVGDLRAEDATPGRLRNVAEELSIAIGEPADHVVVHESTIPNVGTFPTSDGVVVLATTQAVEQLQRAELEALVAAQFSGMRDRWCRLATRAELVWTFTTVLAFASIVFAAPLALFIGVAMVFLPRSVEVTRDLCADVAAVATTRHPAALAGALRHLAPAAGDGHRQRITKRWYLPINPFLVLPQRWESTTSVSTLRGQRRTWTEDEEVAAELDLRADRAEALAAGADPRRYTGREYRRRWSRLGTGVESAEPTES